MNPEPQLGVLVPAIMGVGLAVTLASDAFHRLRSKHRYEQRQVLDGQTSASLVRRGDPARVARVRLRSRWTYFLVGACATGLGIYLTIGVWANFLGFTWWSENIGWIAVLIQLVATAFMLLGAASLLIAWKYRRAPTWIHPRISRTLLGTKPAMAKRRGKLPEPSPRLRLLDKHHVTDRIAAAARYTAIVWSVAAMAYFTFIAEQGRLPQADGGTTLEQTLPQPLQIGLLMIIVIGLVVAWRWEALGAALIAVEVAQGK